MGVSSLPSGYPISVAPQTPPPLKARGYGSGLKPGFTTTTRVPQESKAGWTLGPRTGPRCCPHPAGLRAGAQLPGLPPRESGLEGLLGQGSCRAVAE